MAGLVQAVNHRFVNDTRLAVAAIRIVAEAGMLMQTEAS